MSFLTIGYIGLISVLVLIALRMPIGVTLLLISFFGVWSATTFRAAWGMANTIPFEFLANWSFSAVPMFLLMGYFASYGKLTEGLFGALRILLRHVPGGLACAGVGACALFAAACGSSVATSAAMTRISVPEMLRAGYDKSLATGTIAAAGTLGSLIPPSILMIVYAIFAEVSAGKLFMAGFLPGILSAAMYMILIVARVKANPKLAPTIEFTPTREETVAALKEVWPLPTLVLGVLGGILFGIMTPTEAAAVGASFALLLVTARGALSWKVIQRAVRESAIGTCTVFIIAIGATMFTGFMSMTGVPESISTALLSMASNTLMLILIISLIYLVLGMFIESVGIMLLTLPIILPLLHQVNVDLIWFGIIVIKLLEIGMVTPPVGLNCYVTAASLRGVVPLATVFRGALWFVVADLVTLAFLIAFPQISLFLPSLMTR